MNITIDFLRVFSDGSTKPRSLTVQTDSRKKAEAEILRLFPNSVIHTPWPTIKASAPTRRGPCLPKNIHIGCAWGIGSK